MKTAGTIRLVPTPSRPARENREAAHQAGALVRFFGFKTFWRLVALAVAIVLAQAAAHAIRSTASGGRSPGISMAAGVPARSAGATPAASAQGFRDDESCDLVGEPVECR